MSEINPTGARLQRPTPESGTGGMLQAWSVYSPPADRVIESLGPRAAARK